MFQIIAALMVAGAGAQAEGFYKVTINGKSCGDLLTVEAPAKPQYTSLDYAMSDLVGLFFTYLEKMQNVNETPPSRFEYVLKDMLSMKAEILNDVVMILPQVAVSSMDESRKNLLLNTLYQIIDTMGIPAQVYGFQVDDKGNLSFPGKQRPQDGGFKTFTIAEKSRPAIGFLGGHVAGRDLPDGEHRSIGFGKQTIRGEQPPARVTGSIQRSISKENPAYILIIDGETGIVYNLPIKLVGAQGGKAGDKAFNLDFNNEVKEWFVLVQNLNNPEGKIGFL